MPARVPPAWLVAPLLATRNGLARVRRAMVPPEVALMEASLGIIDTKALHVVAELGVADQLADGPLNAAELAQRCGADPDAIERILRYLVGRGVFARRRDGRFANNRRSRALRAGDGSIGPWLRFFGSEWHVAGWNRLDHSTRTGEAGAEVALGVPFWDHLTSNDPDAGATFDEAMATASSIQTDVVARKYDWSTSQRVCDIGGGTGTLLSGILRANPTLRGVLFDLPSVVARAQPVLDAAGVGDRVEVVGGDFFEGVPAGCDRYLLQAIVHDWDDDSCVRFLSRCRDAMAAGGRVLVLEAPLPRGRGDHFVKALDLEMLVDTGAGRERTRAEYDALFARAGLRVRKVVPIALTSLFELERA